MKKKERGQTCFNSFSWGMVSCLGDKSSDEITDRVS